MGQEHQEDNEKAKVHEIVQASLIGHLDMKRKEEEEKKQKSIIVDLNWQERNGYFGNGAAGNEEERNQGQIDRLSSWIKMMMRILTERKRKEGK